MKYFLKSVNKETHYFLYIFKELVIELNFISFDSVVFYLQSAFGDVYVPDEFEPPSVQTIAAFTKKSHGVSSAPLKVLDAKTLLLPDFTYNGAGKGKNACLYPW